MTNSRRSFLASLLALVPVLGSKAFGGPVKSKTSTIIFVNNTPVVAEMLISPTVTATSVFTPVNAAASLTSTGTAYSATSLAARVTVPDPADTNVPPANITINAPITAVKYPNLGVKTATYNLNWDAATLTLSIVKV